MYLEYLTEDTFQSIFPNPGNRGVMIPVLVSDFQPFGDSGSETGIIKAVSYFGRKMSKK